MQEKKQTGFFKKTGGALCVLLAVMILSSFFAMNRSLNEKVQEVSDLFSDGVFDTNTNYKQKSIKSQLNMRAEASQNLVSLGAERVLLTQETENLRSARNVLVSGIENQAGAKKLYAANTDLQKAFDTLYSKIDALSLDSDDRAIADECKRDMTGAADVISKSGYNEAVREFNRKVLSTFPTNYIKSIALVSEPELFE